MLDLFKGALLSFDPIPSSAPHTRIAIPNAKGDVDPTDEGDMIDELREEAGKPGANATILGEIEDPGTGARVAEAFLGTSADRRTQALAVYGPSLAREAPARVYEPAARDPPEPRACRGDHRAATLQYRQCL